jgi:hypothetical protein
MDERLVNENMIEDRFNRIINDKVRLPSVGVFFIPH